MNNLEDYLNKSKIDAKNRALVRFYKDLPEDVKNNFMSFDEYVREMIEVDESQKDKAREMKMKDVSNDGRPLSENNFEMSGRFLSFLNKRN